MRVRLPSLFSIRPAALTLGTILVVGMLYVSGTPFVDLIELKTYDLRLLSRGRVRPFPAVVLAVIDEKSLATEGRWALAQVQTRGPGGHAVARWGQSHRFRHGFLGAG